MECLHAFNVPNPSRAYYSHAFGSRMLVFGCSPSTKINRTRTRSRTLSASRTHWAVGRAQWKSIFYEFSVLLHLCYCVETNFFCNLWFATFKVINKFVTMGRFAESDINQRDGFIREIFMNVCNSCGADQIKSFAELSNDEERFRFLSSMKGRQVFEVTRNTDSMKNSALALAYKQKGNEKFQSKQWMAAADFYNKSILILPSEHG